MQDPEGRRCGAGCVRPRRSTRTGVAGAEGGLDVVHAGLCECKFVGPGMRAGVEQGHGCDLERD